MVNKYLEYKPSKNIVIGGMAGYSLDADNDSGTKIDGMVLGYRFKLKQGSYYVTSQHQKYSNGYIGINKGFSSHRHQLKKVFGSYDLSLYYNNSIRSPLVITPDSIYTVESIRIEDYGFRSHIDFKRNSRAAITLSNTKQRYSARQGPTVRFYKAMFDYTYRTEPLDFSFNIKNSLIYSVIKDYPGSFRRTSNSNQATLKYKNWGLRSQVDFGPQFYNEVLLAMEEQGSQRGFKLSPFYEFHKRGKTIIHNVTHLDYYKDEVFFNREMLLLRNNINLNMAEAGVQARLSFSLDLLNQKNNMININLRKTIQVKNTGIPKYHDLKIHLFKDQNNNHVFDEGDEPIKQSYIIINDRLALSDESGFVSYKNIEKGNYKLDLRNLSYLVGWVPVLGKEQVVYSVKNNVHAVPFQKSQYITGQVQMIYDPNKTAHFSPYGMKVTLTSKSGETHSTLVNKEREFNFNVPAGHYILAIADESLPREYHIEKTAFSINLVEPIYSKVDFIIRQSQRKIRIRKLIP